MITTPCPICSQLRETMERYPNSVCNNCCNTGIFADPSQTTPITFGNIGFDGGFMSVVNGVEGKQNECYIKGHKCSANEARFGGIVISCFNTQNTNEDDLKRKYKTEYNYYLRSQKQKLENTKDNLIGVDFKRPIIEAIHR
tara:strand:- start:78 stop:500 length:423 start_codon:yes stop_codon:yes gene_type:complete